MIDACFDVANRLFGITMTERKDISGPHPDARVFEVRTAGKSSRPSSPITLPAPPSAPAPG
jgi:Zn-dependent oligopeptidase